MLILVLSYVIKAHINIKDCFKKNLMEFNLI